MTPQDLQIERTSISAFAAPRGALHERSDGGVLERMAKRVSTDHPGRAHDYNACLPRRETLLNNWLPDLGSNQGPAD